MEKWSLGLVMLICQFNAFAMTVTCKGDFPYKKTKLAFLGTFKKNIGTFTLSGPELPGKVIKCDPVYQDWDPNTLDTVDCAWGNEEYSIPTEYRLEDQKHIVDGFFDESLNMNATLVKNGFNTAEVEMRFRLPGEEDINSLVVQTKGTIRCSVRF